MSNIGTNISHTKGQLEHDPYPIGVISDCDMLGTTTQG